MQAQLALSLTRPGGSAARLIVEQEEYGRTDGYLSRSGMFRAIWALLRDEQPDEPVCTHECGTAINVYFDDLGVNYSLHASHGKLGPRVRQERFFTEKLKPSMSRELSLKYPCFGVTDFAWLGGRCWDRDGRQIPPPIFTASRSAIRFDGEVYGTLAVTYRIIRDHYTLALPQRTLAVENQFSSVVYALWAQGPTWEIIEPPPGAEETGAQCTGGGGGEMPTHNPPDDPGPPSAPNRDARVVRDYCSQEVTLDTSK